MDYEREPASSGVIQRPSGLVIDVSPRAVRRALLALVVGLAVASVLAQLAKHHFHAFSPGATNLFDATHEANLPTLYSTLALALSSLLSALIGASSEGGREDPRRWFALAGLFALGAIDETVGLHEQLNDPLRSLLGTTGPLSFPVILPGALLAAVIAILFRRFVDRLPASVRRLAISGALLFAGGALAIEALENAFIDTGDLNPTLTSALIGTISELCEMVGVVLILEALLLYIALERGSVSVTIKPNGPASRVR